MNKVKKYLIAMGAAVLAFSMPVTAYAFGWKSGKETAEEKDYNFVYDKTTIALGAEAAPVLQALGTPEKTFEQDSCAYQGKDKVYTYKGFEVSTYPANGKECIASVYFLDNTAVTPEGIKIGSKEQDIINTYGKADKEEYGIYHYISGKSELVIYTTNQVVDAVEYLIVTK